MGVCRHDFFGGAYPPTIPTLVTKLIDNQSEGTVVGLSGCDKEDEVLNADTISRRLRKHSRPRVPQTYTSIVVSK